MVCFALGKKFRSCIFLAFAVIFVIFGQEYLLSPEDKKEEFLISKLVNDRISAYKKAGRVLSQDDIASIRFANDPIYKKKVIEEIHREVDEAVDKVQTVYNKNEYLECTAKELLDDLDQNALRAKEKYEGQNLKITGKISTFDSDGKYICIESEDNLFSLTFIFCYIKDEETKKALQSYDEDDRITFTGKCTMVGEVLGYSIDIEKIE